MPTKTVWGEQKLLFLQTMFHFIFDFFSNVFKLNVDFSLLLKNSY